MIPSFFKLFKATAKPPEKKDYYFDMQNNPKYVNYSIGRYTYGEPVVLEWDEGATLQIGNFCSIASDVTILLGGNHRSDWVTTFPFSILFDEFKHILGHPSTNGNVVIGNDVWIGTGVLILSGVTIGDGAIVGARSVVTKNIEPYTVVVGNPARRIRNRFSDEIIENLLKIQWWNWDIDKIKENVPLMLSTKIQTFIDENLLF